MGKKVWIAIIVIVVIILACWWLASRSKPIPTTSQVSTSTQAAAKAKTSNEAAIIKSLKGVNMGDIKRELNNINSGQ